MQALNVLFKSAKLIKLSDRVWLKHKLHIDWINPKSCSYLLLLESESFLKLSDIVCKFLTIWQNEKGLEKFKQNSR